MHIEMELAVKRNRTAAVVALTILTGLPLLAACGSPPASAGTAPAPRPKVSSGPCPITAGQFLTALRDLDRELYQRAGNPAALERPTCVDGFSVARTTPDGTHQPSLVLFGLDSATGQWRPLNVGSGDLCVSRVPEPVAAKLPGCS